MLFCELGHKETRIGALLVNQKKITPDDLAEALRSQKEKGGRIGDILLLLNKVTRYQIWWCLKRQRYLRYLFSLLTFSSSILFPPVSYANLVAPSHHAGGTLNLSVNIPAKATVNLTKNNSVSSNMGFCMVDGQTPNYQLSIDDDELRLSNGKGDYVSAKVSLDDSIIKTVNNISQCDQKPNMSVSLGQLNTKNKSKYFGTLSLMMSPE